MRTDGSRWLNNGGLGWVNEYDQRVWRYVVGVGVAAAKAGFDEIQFDYVRFPSDGDISQIVYRGKRAEPKGTTIAQLPALRVVDSCTRSASASRRTCSGSPRRTTSHIGQVPKRVAPYVDALYPMVYPSHFGSGEYGIQDPDAYPGRTVARSLLDFRRQLKGTGTTLIPWLQDFSLAHPYTHDRGRPTRSRPRGGSTRAASCSGTRRASTRREALRVDVAGADVAVVLSGGGMSGIMMELGLSPAPARERAVGARRRRSSERPPARSPAAWRRSTGWTTSSASCSRSGPRRRSARTRSGGCRCSARTTTCCRGRSRSASATSTSSADELAGAERELVVIVTDVTPSARRARHRPALRARLLVPDDAAGGDGAGRARLGGDQRARAAAPGRRPDRHRRRLGAQLPARLRVRAPGGRADRRLPLRAALPGDLGAGVAPHGAHAAAPLLEASAGAGADRRAGGGGRARGARACRRTSPTSSRGSRASRSSATPSSRRSSPTGATSRCNELRSLREDVAGSGRRVARARRGGRPSASPRRSSRSGTTA